MLELKGPEVSEPCARNQTSLAKLGSNGIECADDVEYAKSRVEGRVGKSGRCCKAQDFKRLSDLPTIRIAVDPDIKSGKFR